MQLTQQTDYALRVLIYVAVHSERLVNISEIAECYQISRSHLTKVVANLTKKEYLISLRGHNGGLRLNLEPEAINIGQLVREFEPLSIVECLGPDNTCTITPACLLKCVFSNAIQAFLCTLDQYYLSDLIKNPALRQQFF